MQLEFSGPIWYWKGPSPFFFITVPEDECQDLRMASGLVSYGWGMIPVTARIGKTSWKTALFPKDGQYLVPVRASVRQAEKLSEGDSPAVVLRVAV